MTPSKNIAVIGAGMAGISCARHLSQAGHRVTVLEKSRGVGGRMSTRETTFGSFDHGAQYFTVRDSRFEQALQIDPALCRPWSANAVQVLNAQGVAEEPTPRPREPHWVPTPGMNALLRAWATPLTQANNLLLQTRVTAIEPDALNKNQWQVRTTGAEESTHVYGGFDAVVLAIPSPQANTLLANTPQASQLLEKTASVTVAPCWTLMLAFPQAMQATLQTLGPQWNAARSTHHRIAWLARENSKPGRGAIERWTVQASAQWSQEHINDDDARIQAKLIKAFAEVTGIHAEPAHTDLHRWLYAKTVQPLGTSHLWDAASGIGICGDWCLGARVEDAFVSGLELAQAIAKWVHRIG